MPVSINNTTLTFNDGTTMTSRPVTSVTGAGTVSVSASTGAVTITGTGGTGTVTSVATGNGLQGGTITTSGTLSIAAPGINTVGSYIFGLWGNGNNSTIFSYNSNYAAGSNTNQVQPGYIQCNVDGVIINPGNASPVLSGTWKYMGGTNQNTGLYVFNLGCRVS